MSFVGTPRKELLKVSMTAFASSSVISFFSTSATSISISFSQEANLFPSLTLSFAYTGDSERNIRRKNQEKKQLAADAQRTHPITSFFKPMTPVQPIQFRAPSPLMDP